MSESPAIDSLESALRALADHVSQVHLAGTGQSQFIVAETDGRGFELYPDEKGIVIDPFIEDQLQGEIILESYPEAIRAGLRWIQREG